MGWRVEIRRPVCQAINALCSSGSLFRRGLNWTYAAVRLELPRRARNYQHHRAGHAPDCFVYPGGFWDNRAWHRFVFTVNDSVQPGLLVVEAMDHHARP